MKNTIEKGKRKKGEGSKRITNFGKHKVSLGTLFLQEVPEIWRERMHLEGYTDKQIKKASEKTACGCNTCTEYYLKNVNPCL